MGRLRAAGDAPGRGGDQCLSGQTFTGVARGGNPRNAVSTRASSAHGRNVMISMGLCVLLATAPPAPVTLKAGQAEPGVEVSLVLTGITVPARAEAGLFLFGKLSASSHSLRALLLRSTDGGARWTEVLPEVEHSEVLDVHFTGCQGRALVGWITEGPGELRLFATTDCGATWKQRSKLPKRVWSEWLEQVAWTDAQRGTVWLTDTAAEENH